MARIIVFHFSPAARVPALSAAQCADVRSRFDEVLKDYPGIVFHGVSVDAQGQGICEWEAPNAEVVREIVTKVDGHPPVDGLTVVEQII
jgi:hypothetical protein